jgi:hypothetical protein
MVRTSSVPLVSAIVQDGSMKTQDENALRERIRQVKLELARLNMELKLADLAVKLDAENGRATRQRPIAAGVSRE